MAKFKNIHNWIKRIIKGSGGFKSYEDHELPIFRNGRDMAIAEFVIRALANVDCEGSDEVLKLIIKQRNLKINEN